MSYRAMTALADRLAEPFGLVFGPGRGLTARQRLGGGFTDHEAEIMLGLHRRQTVLTRQRQPDYDRLVERGLVRHFEDYGGASYGLTRAGRDACAGRLR